MNYYPYFNNIPYMAVSSTKPGLFKSLFGSFNLSSIINGTQKTLGIVNQAIPLIKQAKPVLNNARTMFRVMNEFKKTDVDNNVNNVNSLKNKTDNVNTVETPSYANNGPTFFQ